MKTRSRHRTAGPARATPPMSGASSSRGMIRIDTEKIRLRALREHGKAEKALDKLKTAMKRYHENDVPGFRAWMYRHFGPELTRLRELTALMSEKQKFIGDIDYLSAELDIPICEAYLKAVWRREHPEEAEREDREREEKLRREMEEAEREARDIFGPDEDDEWGDDIPDDGPPMGAEDDFDLLSEMLNMLKGKIPGGGRRDKTQTPDGRRARDVYRTIVRRLHPDHHGHMNEAQTHLWHEAQDAYRRDDLNALYGILARCEGGEGGIGKHTPVSLIMHLTRQLKNAARSTRSQMTAMKKDPAWEYENKIKDLRFERKVRADLAFEINDIQWRLRSMEAELASIERDATRPFRKPRKGRGRVSPRNEPDFDLPF